MRHPEHKVQVAVVQWLRWVLPLGSKIAAAINETVILARNDDGSVNQGVAMNVHARRKAAGMLPGFSDLILLLPEGRTFLLEMKDPADGRLDSDQQDFRDDVTMIGHSYGVADSIETARWTLREAGVRLREATTEPAYPWKERLARHKLRLPQDAVPF
jgi:hypothetical protein